MSALRPSARAIATIAAAAGSATAIGVVALHGTDSGADAQASPAPAQAALQPGATPQEDGGRGVDPDGDDRSGGRGDDGSDPFGLGDGSEEYGYGDGYGDQGIMPGQGYGYDDGRQGYGDQGMVPGQGGGGFMQPSAPSFGDGGGGMPSHGSGGS